MRHAFQHMALSNKPLFHFTSNFGVTTLSRGVIMFDVNCIPPSPLQCFTRKGALFVRLTFRNQIAFWLTKQALYIKHNDILYKSHNKVDVFIFFIFVTNIERD